VEKKLKGYLGVRNALNLLENTQKLKLCEVLWELPLRFGRSGLGYCGTDK
jgi:hypothetical protein